MFQLNQEEFDLIFHNGTSIWGGLKDAGDTNVITTPTYARITDHKISGDMATLAGKLKELDSQFITKQYNN